MKTPYTSYLLHIIPKILSGLDRNPDSLTYGSFERNYWQYKVIPFSVGIPQQNCLTLAILYKNNFDGNIYFNKPIIKKYVIAGIKFWTKIQLKDGSFSEYWDNERSIPATAFSLYGICEACDILGYENKEVKKCIRKAVIFLKRHPEKGALNQEMVSAAGIKYASKILKDKEIGEIADEKFEYVLNNQSKEGWLLEYNGADVGYLTVSLDFLIRYYTLSKDPRAIECAKKIIHFIKYFVHPDGSFGGECCTRNTEYFLPYGIEFMKDYEDISYRIIDKLISYINQPGFLNSPIDEKCLLHYTSSSYLKALLIYKNKKVNLKLPCETSFEKLFKEASMYIKSTPHYYFVCSISKSGIFKVMDKARFEMTTDLSYKIEYKNKVYTPEFPSPNKFNLVGNKLIISSKFKKIKLISQSPLKLIALSLLSKIVGHYVVILTKRFMIYNQEKFEKDMFLRRSFTFENSKIIIEDELYVGNREVMVFRRDGLALRYISFSKYFQINTLNNKIKRSKFYCKNSKKIRTVLEFAGN